MLPLEDTIERLEWKVCLGDCKAKFNSTDGGKHVFANSPTALRTEPFFICDIDVVCHSSTDNFPLLVYSDYKAISITLQHPARMLLGYLSVSYPHARCS